MSNMEASSDPTPCIGMCNVCSLLQRVVRGARPANVAFGGPYGKGQRERGQSLTISTCGQADARCNRSSLRNTRDSGRSSSNRASNGNSSKPSRRNRRAAFSPRAVERIRSLNRELPDAATHSERKLFLNCLLTATHSECHSFASSGSSRASSMV